MPKEKEFTLSLARAAVERIQSVVGAESAMAHYQLAWIEALSGNEELALNQFQMAVELGFSQVFLIKYDIRLEPLRGLPRFTALIQSMEQRNKAAREAILALGFS